MEVRIVGLKRVILPVLGIDMESAVVEKWLKAEGDAVARDEPIVLVETDKASTEIVAPVAGVLKRIVAPSGTTVPVTDTIALIEVEGAGDEGVDGETGRVGEGETNPSPAPLPLKGVDMPEGMSTGPGVGSAQQSAPDHGPLRASPAARKVAEQLGIDLALVKGTGPAGRIQGEDVRTFAAATASRAAGLATQSSVHSPQSSLPGRLVPLSKKRRITAERMSLSARTVARLTLNTEIDATEMIALRARLLPVYEAASGVRLSYNDILVKAVATALGEHPYLNARWADDGIYLVDAVNIGVAMAMEDGLVVPVVHDAAGKTLAEISIEVNRLLSKSRQDRLSLVDITGGTFTITNLGMFGIDSFTPIVNPPEAAILGVGRIVERPVGRDGRVVLRPMMGLSLSFDHRIVDGAPAARFLQRLQQLLEGPASLT